MKIDVHSAHRSFCQPFAAFTHTCDGIQQCCGNEDADVVCGRMARILLDAALIVVVVRV